MARKRKENKVTSEPIVYSGEVIIKSVGKNGKVRQVKKHNEGGLALFTFLTKALQDSMSPRFRPTSIMCYGDGNVELLTSKVTYTGTPQLYNGATKVNGSDASTDGSNAIQYTFLIPFGIVKETEGTQAIKKVKFLNDFGDVCAQITTNFPIENGTNILIYWKMSFMNGEISNGGSN